MKKIYFLISALLISLVMIQCNKPNMPIGNVQHVVLKTSNGNDGSKIGVSELATGALNLTWENTDEIIVSGAGKGTLYLSEGAGQASAVFEGDITIIGSGSLVFEIGNKNPYMNQTGKLEDLKNVIYLVGSSEYREDGKYNVSMSLPYAIVKVNLSQMCTPGDAGEVQIRRGNMYGETMASVSYVDANSKDMYVALPAYRIGLRYTFVLTNAFSACDETWALNPGTYYTENSLGSGEAFKIKRQYVDLGLKSKILWATCNMGAEKETEIGDYYAWGELEPYKTSDGSWCDKTNHQNPFNEEIGFGWFNYLGTPNNKYNLRYDWLLPRYENDTTMPKENDAAYKTFGEEWGIPLYSQLIELFKYTHANPVDNKLDSIGVVLNGLGDYSKARLFIPRTQYYDGTILLGEEGFTYLVGSRSAENAAKVVRLIHNYDGATSTIGEVDRCVGMAIRPMRVIKSK